MCVTDDNEKNWKCIVVVSSWLSWHWSRISQNSKVTFACVLVHVFHYYGWFLIKLSIIIIIIIIRLVTRQVPVSQILRHILHFANNLKTFLFNCSFKPFTSYSYFYFMFTFVRHPCYVSHIQHLKYGLFDWLILNHKLLTYCFTQQQLLDNSIEHCQSIKRNEQTWNFVTCMTSKRNDCCTYTHSCNINPCSSVIMGWVCLYKYHICLP